MTRPVDGLIRMGARRFNADTSTENGMTMAHILSFFPVIAMAAQSESEIKIGERLPEFRGEFHSEAPDLDALKARLAAESGKAIKVSVDAPQSTYDRNYARTQEIQQRSRSGKVVVRRDERAEEMTRQGRLRYYLNRNTLHDTVLKDWNIFTHELRTRSGKHRHQGGLVIYVIEGKGYTVVEGQRQESLHVVGREPDHVVQAPDARVQVLLRPDRDLPTEQMVLQVSRCGAQQRRQLRKSFREVLPPGGVLRIPEPDLRIRGVGHVQGGAVRPHRPRRHAAHDERNRLRSDGQRLVLGKRFETLESAEVYADYLAVKCSLEIKDQVLIVHDEQAPVAVLEVVEVDAAAARGHRRSARADPASHPACRPTANAEPSLSPIP